MVTVHRVTECPDSDLLWELSTDSERFPELETLDDYRTYVQQENGRIEITDAAAAAASAADQACRGQGPGVIIGWQDESGDILLECVYVD